MPDTRFVILARRLLPKLRLHGPAMVSDKQLGRITCECLIQLGYSDEDVEALIAEDSDWPRLKQCEHWLRGRLESTLKRRRKCILKLAPVLSERLYAGKSTREQDRWNEAVKKWLSEADLSASLIARAADAPTARGSESAVNLLLSHAPTGWRKQIVRTREKQRATGRSGPFIVWTGQTRKFGSHRDT